MKFSELIDSCIECIKNFNPIIKTIDSHADDFLKDVRDANRLLIYNSLKILMKKFSSSKFSTDACATKNS
jgi:hypothetical protein